MNLLELQCQPCHAKTDILSLDGIYEYLKQIPNWHYEPNTEIGPVIKRTVECKNFSQCKQATLTHTLVTFLLWPGVDHICNIRDVAEEQNHHPDIHLTRYKHLEIVIHTFAINNLTINDFVLAAKIERLFSVSY
eukprot:jgi/Galph1/4399/GphlegSOOS_G3062.1